MRFLLYIRYNKNVYIFIIVDNVKYYFNLNWFLKYYLKIIYVYYFNFIFLVVLYFNIKIFFYFIEVCNKYILVVVI